MTDETRQDRPLRSYVVTETHVCDQVYTVDATSYADARRRFYQNDGVEAADHLFRRAGAIVIRRDRG